MELNINKTDKSLTLIFSDDVGKFGTSEILDEYYLTNEQLLNILQKYDEMLEGLKEALKFAKMKNDDIMVEYFTRLIKEATEL